MSDVDLLKRKLERERKAREAAEQLLEAKSRELYQSNQELEQSLTDLKNTQVQLIQASKMESLGTLAGGIAHEINTPIQYIGDNLRFLSDGFNDLKELIDCYEAVISKVSQTEGVAAEMTALEEEKESADPEYLFGEAVDAAKQSLDGVSQVTRIVLAMKEFAHPKTKEKLPVALNAIIERATTICRGEWKHNAELELALEDSLPTVLGSEGELNQVVLNLVVNASHAIGDSGQAKGRITVTSQSIKTGVRLEVRENGGGIPEAARERVFDAFFTTKEVGKRSGQGLAICHDVIVNKHGGTIRFETETGVGTAFIIDLPFEIAVVSETALTATDFPLREILLRPRPDTFGAMLDLIEHLRPIDGHDFSVPDDIATVDEDVCDVAAARIVD